MNGDITNSGMSGQPGAKPLQQPNMDSMNTEQVVTEQITVAQAEPTIPQPEQAVPSQNDDGKKKKTNTMLLALIFCLILAAGGIGFGVWAMLDGNSRASSLNSQIASLNSQIATLQEQNIDLSQQIVELKKGDVTGGGSIAAELVDGIFYVKDSGGEILATSSEVADAENLEITQIVSCERRSENTIIDCVVETSQGEGNFLYDVYGESLSLSFGKE